jgi:ribokinase
MLVTGIGQCSWDYLALIDAYPQVDTKKEVLSLKEQGGGPVATALVALSRLGVKCRFYGITGDDYEGEKIRQSLITEGIDTDGLIKRPQALSQLAFIAIEENTGKRTIFWRRPSGRELTPEELGEDFLKDSSFLLIDGLMKEVSLYAAKKAREMNVPVMLDAGRLREGMLQIAASSDYVVASEEFAKDLGWDGSVEKFKGMAKNISEGVVTVTLGERGSITFLNGEVIHIPAFKVDAVDTTGAGDVFHGGYIYGLLKGWDIPRTIRFASAMAALKCREIGGRAGIPVLDEVSEFLGKRT